MPVCTPKWGTWGTWFEIGVQSGVHRLMYDDVIIFGFTFGFSFSFCFGPRVSAACLILSPACSLKLVLGSNPSRAFHFYIFSFSFCYFQKRKSLLNGVQPVTARQMACMLEVMWLKMSHLSHLSHKVSHKMSHTGKPGGLSVSFSLSVSFLGCQPA